MITTTKPTGRFGNLVMKEVKGQSHYPALRCAVSYLLCFFICCFAHTVHAEEIDYQYDSAQRLIRTQYQGNAIEDFTYDAMGNRLTYTISDGYSPTNHAPSLPASPMPADGTTGVLSGSQFSWNSSDPDANDIVVYRIYLGTTFPPPLMYIQRETHNFSSNKLKSFTTYYWRVIATDNRNGVAEGPIWQFATGNTSPHKPELEIPIDQAPIGYRNIELKWECAGDPNPNDSIVYDLYFGTSSDPILYEANVATTHYDINGLTEGLDTTAVYYWQVVARDNHGAETHSDIRQFSFLDSDDDGLPDDLENTMCTYPTDADSDNDNLPDGMEDADHNGVVNNGETHPCNNDSDGDNMSDGWETGYGTNPLINDAVADIDGDGYDNLTEFIENTDPFDTDVFPGNKRLENFESGDFSNFFWITDPEKGWHITDAEAFGSRYAARTRAIGDNQTSDIETRLLCDSGTISFFFKVSSEEADDQLFFYIDDTQQGQWSGNLAYNRVTFPVAAGWHTFKWAYVKGESGASGQDGAWIDDILFPGVPDSDEDGVIDGWEIFYFGDLNQNLCDDSNGDGISDLAAALTLADPIGGDTDGDGMADLWETDHGLNSNEHDAWLDPDNDGYANYDEFIGHSDPNNTDDRPRHVLENFETGDLTKFYWRLDAGAPWWVTGENPYRGRYSAQPPALTDGQSAAMETVINCAQGFVGFRYAVSSETDGDYLRFYIDDTLQAEWSGEVPYTFAVFPVTGGVHRFRWEYAKNASVAGLDDTAWVDDISFPGSGDSDRDGVLDAWEYTFFDALNMDLCNDSNGDGISDLQAALVLADPITGDTDGDGMADIYEATHGLNLNTDDAWNDPDGDGYANYDEYIGDSDPNDVDNTPRNVLENFESGDLTKFYWRLGGDAVWSATQDYPHQGMFSAQAPVLTDSQSAFMETTINCIDGYMAFYHSVASDPAGDQLRFYIDNLLQQEWSGDLDYQFATFAVAAGVHTFKWEYAKDGSGAQFEDSAWIDNISFPGSGDSDGDGVPDGWEYTHFNGFDQDLCVDTDDDGLLDLQEALLQLDPMAFQPDTDTDGMDDGWEQWHFGGLTAADDTTDADGDGLPDTDEYANRTDPHDPDCDGDGYTDGEEVTAGTNPLDDQQIPGSLKDLDADGDMDGSDLAVLAFEFGRNDCDQLPVCAGNLDHDNDVDVADLLLLLEDYGSVIP